MEKVVTVGIHLTSEGGLLYLETAKKVQNAMYSVTKATNLVIRECALVIHLTPSSGYTVHVHIPPN